MATLSKNVIPGTTQTGAPLRVQKGAPGNGWGRHTAYAGPIRLLAKRKCVVRGGDFARAAWQGG
ncbi:hypothetical protein AB0F88_28530 [Streptosporangium sp. NPDC023963]|uniref:hypothetical protein n=1 Tax=Streptosporangium sp. NPDC023963 TaxID=3155608 RepID=UPI00343B1768